MSLRKQTEIDRLNREGVARIGILTEHAFLAAGTALYAAEGSKNRESVEFANTDWRLMRLFCCWLRHFFEIDESRLKAHLYLHQGHDLDAAIAFWAEVTGIPRERFGKAYRAVPDAGIRNSKHQNGCLTVRYHCTRTHRAIMGMVRALSSFWAIPTTSE